MALNEFVTRVDHLRRMAAVGPVDTVPSEGVNGSVHRTDSVQEGTNLWLAGILGRHFSRDDFAGADPATLDELADSVSKFDRLAGHFNREVAPPSGRRVSLPASPEDRAAGRKLLNRIGEIVDAYLRRSGTDDEETKVRGALEELAIQYADEFKPIDYRLGMDSTGDPGGWIWAKIPENSDVSAPEFRKRMDKFREDVFDTFRRGGAASWPYVSVRKVSEHAGLLFGGSGR